MVAVRRNDGDVFVWEGEHFGFGAATSDGEFYRRAEGAAPNSVSERSERRLYWWSGCNKVMTRRRFAYS